MRIVSAASPSNARPSCVATTAVVPAATSSGSSNIAQTAEGIRDATDVNREATLALNTVVGGLQQQTASLRHEMTAFRVTRPADEPAS